VKSAEEIMNMLEAFDLTGSLRDAGELAGVSHHTVARYVAARESGVAGRGVARPMLIDEFLPKVEEWIERSNGKLRADVAHDKLLALGCTPADGLVTRQARCAKAAGAGPIPWPGWRGLPRGSHPVPCTKVVTFRLAVELAPGNTAIAARPLAHQPLRWLHSGRVYQCPHDEQSIRLCSAGMKN
jgi:hypothetical protein